MRKQEYEGEEVSLHTRCLGFIGDIEGGEAGQA